MGTDLARRRLLDLFLQNFHLLFDSLDGIQRLAGFLHLFLQRVDLLLQDGDFQLAFRPGFFEHLPAFVFDVLQSFFQLEPGGVRALLGFFGFLAFAAGLVALAADVVQHLVGAQVQRVDLTLRIGDDLLGKSEPRGNGQGVGAPGQADGQLVGRAQRLHVEFQRGIDHARRAVGERLQLGVVRGDEGRHAARQQVAEDGARQRGAFLRVGARAQLVQDDQQRGCPPA